MKLSTNIQVYIPLFLRSLEHNNRSALIGKEGRPHLGADSANFRTTDFDSLFSACTLRAAGKEGLSDFAKNNFGVSLSQGAVHTRLVAGMSKIVESFQADLPTRIFRVTNSFNESMYLAANEPSLGMYRLQEHVQTNVPRVVMQKQSLYGVSVSLLNVWGALC